MCWQKLAEHLDSRGELSPRQVTIMYMLASGWSHKRIAKKLGIRPGTINKYLYEGEYSVFAKLDSYTIAQAMAKWMRRDN